VEAGIAMLPFATAMLVFPQVGRRLSRYLGSAEILALGLLIVALGNLILMFAAVQQGPRLLISGMAILGAGGGLLNGETQKAIMGTVPRSRAGMASGISTTSRFTGILLGFAGLGAVLASGVKSAIENKLIDAGVSAKPGFFEYVMAGDFERAIAMYPHELTETLNGLAQQSYSQGFAGAFVIAAMFSLLASAAVYGLMRSERSCFQSPAI
ncbi:MAG: MFS transporter, partial [Alphaproteobacteria bacterium]